MRSNWYGDHGTSGLVLPIVTPFKSPKNDYANQNLAAFNLLVLNPTLNVLPLEPDDL